MVKKKPCALVLDNTTLDKPYSKKEILVANHWSGKHTRLWGVNVMTLLWTEVESSGQQTSEHTKRRSVGRARMNIAYMPLEARSRTSKPRYVIFDGWYSNLDNSKLIGEIDSPWFTRLKENRQVGTDRREYMAVSEVEIPRRVWRQI